MKNWQITGFLSILLVGILLISGCTSAPTEKIVYVTVLVTPTPTVTPAQDPIINTWVFTYGPYSSGGSVYEIKYRVNADHTYSETLYANSEYVMSYSGTWVAQGNNLYRFNNPKTGEIKDFIYDPVEQTVKKAPSK